MVQRMNQSRFWAIFRGAITLFVLLSGAAISTPARAAGAAMPPPDTENVSLALSPAAVKGGNSTTGTVQLNHKAPNGGTAILLKSSNSAAKVPASVAVPQGATAASFTVTTSAVSANVTVTIKASYKNATATASLTLEANQMTSKIATIGSHASATASQPAQGTYSMSGNSIASVSINPSAIDWGGSATGTVQLVQPAPTDKVVNGKLNIAKPVVVSLASSHSSVKVPKSVTLPKGRSTATFSVTVLKPSPCSLAGASPATATITATYKGSRAASLQIGQKTGKPSRYTSKTIGIDPKMILGVSHDAHALILDGGDKCVQSLVAGDVIFLKGLGVLKVNKVMKMPPGQVSAFKVASGVAVAVGSASLTDFINDGTFQVFKQTLGDVAPPTGPWASDLKPDEPGNSDTPWKYKTSGTGTTYSFLAYKQNGGLQASVTGNGQISKFGFNFLAVIHNSKLQQATYKVDTDGVLDVDWNAQTTGPGEGIGESRLRLPAMHSGLVDSADGIPLLFQVYGNLIFKPGFGEKAAAKGHFRVIYSGEGGLDGSTPLNEGLHAQTEISSTTSSAKAPHGAVVAINAPKFALSLSTVSFLYAADARMPNALNTKGADLADSLQGQLGVYAKTKPTPDDPFAIRRAVSVSWVTSVAYAGAGMLAMFPCQQYYQTFLTLAGADKAMLGSISGSIPPKKSVTVFQDKKVTLIPAIKGCEPKPN